MLLIKHCYYYYYYYYYYYSTQRVNTPSNKTQARINSMNLDIWVIGTLNQQFVRDSYTENKFSKK